MKNLKYRNECITELLRIHFAHTYVIANRLRMRGVRVETKCVLENMKRLEKDGYAKSTKEGLGYRWSLTEDGIEKFKASLTPTSASKVNRDIERAVKAKISDGLDGHKKSIQYLSDCMEVQKQRGEQYDSKGTGERSFAAAASAFNAMTGQNLKGSDVCLLLTCVKAVRQYSDPSRVHEDSLLDLVSYASLWAEELNKEVNHDRILQSSSCRVKSKG